MKSHPRWFTVLVSGLMLTGANAPAQNLNWVGGAATNGWSEPANWTNTISATVHAPTPTNVAAFVSVTVPSPTNSAGVVDNVVDANFTIRAVSYVEDAAHAHTTLINPGITLQITQNPGVAANTIAMGNVTTDNAAQLIWTVIGTNGARLASGDPLTPDLTHQMVISERFNSVTPFTQRGTLDMGKLDNFTFSGGIIILGSNPSGGKDWPRGRIILARTNLIIAAQTTTPSIKVGHLAGNGTGGDGDLQLGQTNAIFAASMRIGSVRASIGTMEFQSGLSNPTLFLRGPDGVSAAATIGIGDSVDQTVNVNATATGVVDLTAGTVDVMVNDLIVGRNLSLAANSTGHGNGTLKWTTGLISTVNVSIGSQAGDNRGNATGVVTVRSNATLTVNNAINIGSDLGTRNGTANGTLNIGDGGVVSVVNDVSETSAGVNGTSTLNLTNGYLSTGGAITVDNLNAVSGTISNGGMLTVSNLMGGGTIYGPVTVNGVLAPGNGIGTLTISNDLVLSATSTNVFEVNTDTLAHDRVTGLNNVTYGGTLVINPSGSGTAITNGASVKIFDAATGYNGSFAAILPAVPGPGLAWVTNGLTNGIIGIVVTVSTTPTNLTFSLTGNQMNIAWPADHTGWRLQGQTNSLAAGLTTNWFTVPNSSGTNQVFLPLNPAEGAVFYRLVFP